MLFLLGRCMSCGSVNLDPHDCRLFAWCVWCNTAPVRSNPSREDRRGRARAEVCPVVRAIEDFLAGRHWIHLGVSTRGARSITPARQFNLLPRACVGLTSQSCVERQQDRYHGADRNLDL